MMVNSSGVFLLGAMTVLVIAPTLPAQESPEQIAKKLKALDERLEALRRKEMELLKEQELLRQKVRGNRVLQTLLSQRAAKEAAWHKKHLPSIETRAKLRSMTISNLLFPPTVITTWSIDLGGKYCQLEFGDTPQPFELRDEQDVEVIINGKLEVRGIMYLDRREVFREITTVTIHVDSIKKAPKK
ncbi:MAG: hypothetical protein HYX68_19460 [Planctomycetes bacterium]|nr:hypothetical protein [Planctomycetota bacterium]